ncbi:glycosyltransferase [Patescibacteria group bacterium]
MSQWKTWQQFVSKTHKPLMLQQTGLVNRNYHVLNQLRKRPEINKILAVDLIPFTTKRCLRVFKESILGKVPGKNITGKFKADRWKTKITQVDEKMQVFSTARHLLKKDHANKIWGEISDVMSKSDFDSNQKLLWSYYPMYPLPFENFSGTKVFDAVDDWREHPYCKSWRMHLDKSYQAIDKNSNSIFTVSKAVQKLFPTNPNVHWVPNGIDFDHYQKTGSNLTDKLGKIKKPVIGYLGIIESRLDFTLLEKIATKFPQASLVLAGPVWKHADVKRLQAKPNVFFPGPISYNDLPELYNFFDIGIIPHKITSFTKSMNPLKMYEYLACGLPVVTTPVAGVESFSDNIDVAQNECAFLSEIKKHLDNPLSDSEKAKQRQVVKNQTWQNRLDKMFSFIPHE